MLVSGNQPIGRYWARKRLLQSRDEGIDQAHRAVGELMG
jgi:hypothetical protein